MAQSQAAGLGGQGTANRRLAALGGSFALQDVYTRPPARPPASIPRPPARAVHVAEEILSWSSIGILGIFAAELLAKLVCFGGQYFSHSRWHMFDAGAASARARAARAGSCPGPGWRVRCCRRSSAHPAVHSRPLCLLPRRLRRLQGWSRSRWGWS